METNLNAENKKVQDDFSKSKLLSVHKNQNLTALESLA